jgi:hypothetical protein
MAESNFDKQYGEAKKRGDERLRNDLRAKSAVYDPSSKRVIVELANGCIFMFPPRLAQGLETASADDLSEIRLLARGLALNWPRLDVQLSLSGLMMGIFGTKAWMSELARKGGISHSESKAKAARQNGRKGGRPRKRA